MTIAKAPETYVDEPSHTTPINAAALNYTETRLSEVQAEVERMIAAGAVTTAQYGVVGDGVTDDTERMQNFLNACKERAGVILPGKIKVKSALNVRVASEVYGLNQRSCQILREGNGDLFDLEEGAINMKNFRVAALAEQTTPGAAFELIGAGGNDIRIEDILLGSNFYNGFSLIPTSSGGAIDIDHVRVEDVGAGVKGIKGAVFVLGNDANRAIGIHIRDVTGIGLNKAGVAKWFEANNTDSCTVTDALFQTGTQGVVVGNNNPTGEGTTSINFVNVIVDGGIEGMIGWNFARSAAVDLYACHGQGAEMYVGENVHALTMTGGALWACQNNGLRLGGAAGFPIKFVGVNIGNNNIVLPAGTAVNAESSPLCADVQVENGAAKAAFINCFFGSVFGLPGPSCRSYFPVWFTAAATPTTKQIVAINPFWVQGGNSTKQFTGGSPRTPMGNAGVEIYGFKTAGEAAAAAPVPIVW